MLNDEKTKEKLLLSYKIVKLYLKAGCSVSVISSATDIPLATVKRSLKAVGAKKEQYLRLLPELGTEKELDEIQHAVNVQIADNKRVNKWKKDEQSLYVFLEDVQEIQKLYQESRTVVTNEDKKKMLNLRFNGASIRTIAEATGHSLDSVHGVVKGINDNKGSSKK